jgi:hypothetical protein
MFDKSVKFVEIDIRKQLACYVSERQSLAGVCLKTFDNLFKKRERSFVSNLSSDELEKDFVVNVGEELYNIALERIRRPLAICRPPADKLSQSPNAAMCSLVESARIRVVYETSVKEVVHYAEDGLVYNAVAHARFMDVPPLRIGNIE